MGKNAQVDRLTQAARQLQAGENRADFVSELGALLGQGALTSEQLKTLRVALTEAELENPEQRAYARALRDVLRSVEAARYEREHVASIEEMLERPETAKVLVALSKAPAGPGELAAMLKKDQAQVSRLLKWLEEAGLVAVIETGDGRVRRRELTPRGHHAARSAQQRTGRRGANASLEDIVSAAVDVLGVVMAFPSLRVSDITSIARRRLSLPLARRLAAALPSAGETAGLLDSNKELVRWGAVQDEHLALLEILREAPQQWNDAIERALGSSTFVMVVKNADGWRSTFNERPASEIRVPDDIQSPSYFYAMQGERTNVIFDDSSVAEQHGAMATRSLVASAIDGRVVLQ